MAAAVINSSSDLIFTLGQAFSHCELMHDASEESSSNTDEVSKTAVNYKKHKLLDYKFFFSVPHSGNHLNNYMK